MRTRRRGRGRRVLIAALFLLAAALATACGNRSSAGREAKEEGGDRKADQVQIGLCFDSFVIERWLRDRDVFSATAQELGAKVNVQSANGDVNEQIAQIRYLISKKMDAIVIIAIDSDTLTDVIKEAKDKGIKVICYDRLIMNADADLYVSFDNEKVGELMGQALREALPGGGKVFEILGSSTDHNTTQVKAGFEKTLAGSGVEIVYSASCDNWLAELAFDAVNDGLAENGGRVDGVMCGNDDLAGHAIRALTESRLAGRIPVVGQDADLSGCQRIVEGTQTMSVYKSVEEEAKVAAKLAVALAKGEDITGEEAEVRVTDTIDNGTYRIPCYSIDPVAVNRQNMDQVIVDSGFHRAEDVYRNVETTEQSDE